MRPSSAGGPNKNPHTTSKLARTNPATTWKACGPIIGGPHCRQGKGQSRAKVTVVTASQRPSPILAGANARPVPVAGKTNSPQKAGLSEETRTGRAKTAATADP